MNTSDASTMHSSEARVTSDVRVNGSPTETVPDHPVFHLITEDGGFAAWIARVRRVVREHVEGFVAARCTEELAAGGISEQPARVVLDFVSGGKHLRAVLMYLGWLCGAEESQAALRAASGLELLHAFALLQDDVMDESATRRGRPAAHVRLARWHREEAMSGSSARFGESAAVLLGDLCLVWAEQMLRESGVPEQALARVWPRYDAMRSELAIGQLADLANDATRVPSLDDVLDIARRKSGNYTVRRPLELGAAMAGCPPRVMEVLAGYGALIGEAFQIRDDLLGLFGDPTVTGKPTGADLYERKATTVVALAQHLAAPSGRARLHQLWSHDEIGDETVAAALTVITDSGAPQRAEEMITERLRQARSLLEGSALPRATAAALDRTALLCTLRSR